MIKIKNSFNSRNTNNMGDIRTRRLQKELKMVQAEKHFIEEAETCDGDIGKWQVTLMNINELF